MYFASTLTIDPSQLTSIRRKPTRGFRRLAEILTANVIATREEHESFTALSILQDFNRAFRSIGVTDVVEIKLDDRVLYEDQQGNDQHDFDRAISAINSATTMADQASFQQMQLLLEHQLTHLTVVIRTTIERVHRPGVYPIRVEINGLDSELQQASEDQETLTDKMNAVFETQASYDDYVQQRRDEFDAFIDQVERAIEQTIQVQHILRKVTTNVIRPGLQNSSSRGAQQDSTDPTLGRYNDGPGIGGDLAYMMMWSHFMHSHHTQARDITLVNEQGGAPLAIGEAGINAGDSPLFNPDIEFDARELVSMPELSPNNAEITSQDVAENGGIFSWLDGFSFGDDTYNNSSNIDTGDGGSSCGSSCGGGGD